MEDFDPTRLFGREILAASERSRRRWLHLAVAHWRSAGFPFPQLRRVEVEREFDQLKCAPISKVLDGGNLRTSTLGLRLANSFHPQLWSIPAHRHLRSPLDHFQDDEILAKLLERGPRFWPNRRCWNAQCLRSLIRIYAGGRIANFRPTAARAIIARYSRDDQAVLDFSAGFGGRLLGCLTLPRRYVGMDPAAAQVSGLRRMVAAIGTRSQAKVVLHKACAEDLLPRMEPRTVDLVFSSPPYFNTEKYSHEPTQSFQRYRSYTSWKNSFLRPVIEASHRVLRSAGYLVINVADTGRLPLAEDLLETASAMFRAPQVLRLFMHSRPLQRSSGEAAFRWEPVFVFKKS